MALAGTSIYVVTIDLPLTFTNRNEAAPTALGGRPTGEVEALSLANGKVQWDRKLGSVPVGAATVSNDLVFTALLNKTLLAVNRRTGAIAYQRQAAHDRERADCNRGSHARGPGRKPRPQGLAPTAASRGLHGPVAVGETSAADSLGQPERREQVVFERSDLDEPPLLDPQHVERQRPEHAVAGART